MIPYHRAMRMYDREEDFIEVVRHCMEHGEVHSTTDLFVCAHRTHSSLVDSSSDNEIDTADTWFIHVAVGSVERILEREGAMKYVAYERSNGKIRLIPIRRFSWASKKQ